MGPPCVAPFLLFFFFLFFFFLFFYFSFFFFFFRAIQWMKCEIFSLLSGCLVSSRCTICPAKKIKPMHNWATGKKGCISLSKKAHISLLKKAHLSPVSSSEMDPLRFKGIEDYPSLIIQGIFIFSYFFKQKYPCIKRDWILSSSLELGRILITLPRPLFFHLSTSYPCLLMRWSMNLKPRQAACGLRSDRFYNFWGLRRQV